MCPTVVIPFKWSVICETKLYNYHRCLFSVKSKGKEAIENCELRAYNHS